jgi:hypothetical protein
MTVLFVVLSADAAKLRETNKVLATFSAYAEKRLVLEQVLASLWMLLCCSEGPDLACFPRAAHVLSSPDVQHAHRWQLSGDEA